jgi:hypothetical protein
MAEDVVVEPTQPPDPSVKVGPGPTGVPGTPPKGYVALSPGERNAAIGKVAASLLGGTWGALTPFRVGNKHYMARVEPHHHPAPPAGASPEEQKKYPKPWGWHKGVTVYKASSEPVASTEEYTPDKPQSGRMQFLQRIDQFLNSLGKA